MRIEQVEIAGTHPGWIHRHAARVLAGQRIEITGGEIVRRAGDKEEFVPNEASYVLDTAQRTWIS
jgi:hypothetical protein